MMPEVCSGDRLAKYVRFSLLVWHEVKQNDITIANNTFLHMMLFAVCFNILLLTETKGCALLLSYSSFFYYVVYFAMAHWF